MSGSSTSKQEASVILDANMKSIQLWWFKAKLT